MDNFVEYCKNGDLEAVKQLVDQGYDPHENLSSRPLGRRLQRQKDNNSAIQLASQNGHLEVVKYLLSVGCDPQADDNEAIQLASTNGHLEVLKYLVSVGCDPQA